LTETVIFDLDGTLINLPIDYERLFQEFSKIMKTKNIHPVTKTISKTDEKTRKKIFEAWEKTELAALKNKTLINEGIALYKKHANERKALVTMQGRTLVHNVLETLNLTFDAVVTREDSLDRAEQLKTAAKKLEACLEDVLFVGNTKGDSIAAGKIGCKFMRVGNENLV
jgi:HAD superfamily hydrolase (TIGR01549 family)